MISFSMIPILYTLRIYILTYSYSSPLFGVQPYKKSKSVVLNDTRSEKPCTLLHLHTLINIREVDYQKLLKTNIEIKC